MDTRCEHEPATCALVAELNPEAGELYLFHPSDSACPADESLWAMVAEVDEGCLVIESASTDLRHFTCWFTLSEAYRYYRLATRAELRDYSYNLALAEAARW